MINFSPLRLAGRAVDALVGVFSPRAGLSRLSLRSAMYAAAKTTRTGGDWSPIDSTINTIVSNSAVPIRARVRQLVRDFLYFAAAANRLSSYVVGPGIIYQSAIRDASGKLDLRRRQQAEDAFNFAADEIDITGRDHLS